MIAITGYMSTKSCALDLKNFSIFDLRLTPSRGASDMRMLLQGVPQYGAAFQDRNTRSWNGEIANSFTHHFLVEKTASQQRAVVERRKWHESIYWGPIRCKTVTPGTRLASLMAYMSLKVENDDSRLYTCMFLLALQSRALGSCTTSSDLHGQPDGRARCESVFSSRATLNRTAISRSAVCISLCAGVGVHSSCSLCSDCRVRWANGNASAQASVHTHSVCSGSAALQRLVSRD